MKTPEGELKKELKAYLDGLGAYWFAPVQTGYGKATLDFLCCVRGRFIAIETKAPGKKPTPRQLCVMEEIERAGGYAFWTDDFNTARNIILSILSGPIGQGSPVCNKPIS